MLSPAAHNDARPALPRLDSILEFLLMVLLIALPAVQGGIDARGEMIAISIGAAIAVVLALRTLLSGERIGGGWVVWTPIALFVALALAQLIVLPAGVTRIIAPGTHAFKSELLADLPEALARMSITFYSRATLHDLRLVLLAITVFAAVLTICRKPARMQRLLMAIALVGAAVTVLALAQTLSGTHKAFWLIDIGRPARSGPFFNHSHFGQFMNLSLAAGVVLLLLRPTRWSSALPLTLFIALGWLAIALSRTRGGMISAALAGALMLLALILRRRLRWFIPATLVVLALAALILLALPAAPLSQFRSDTRVQIVRDVLVMSEQLGRTGAGLGTFQWTFTPFDRTDQPNVTAHADNEYVHILAEMGWVGLALVLLFAGVIWWHWTRAIRSGEQTRTVIAIGLGYGLLAVMIHSLTDFGQHIPSNFCLSAAICGMLVRLARATDPPHSSRRAWRVAVAIIMLLVAGWAVIEADRARRGEAHASAARRVARTLENAGWTGEQEQMDRLRAHIDDAVAAEPGNVDYRYRRALYTWRVAAREHARGSEALRAAARNVVAQLNAARRLCPTYGLLYSLLGQIELAYLEMPIGLTHLEMAAKLEPNDPYVWFATGRVDARRGDFDSANRKFRRALMLNYLVIHDIMRLYLDELRVTEPAIALAEGDHYFMGFVGNLMMARPEYRELGGRTYQHARELLVEEARRVRTPQLLARAGFGIMEGGKPDVAEELLAEALRADPSQTDWRVGHAQALVRLNRLEEAERELSLAARQHPDLPRLETVRRELEQARQKAK